MDNKKRKLDRLEVYAEYIFSITWHISAAICVAGLAVLMIVISIHYIIDYFF